LISQTAEYALRAVVHLAYHFPESCTSSEIAKATKVPTSYLAKIMQDLSRAQVVKSRRGVRGGFALLREPKHVTVFDVLDAVDPPKRIRTCPLGLRAHAHQLCPLHTKLDRAMADAESVFRSTTIAEVTATGTIEPLRERPTRLTISPGLAVHRNNGARRTVRRKA